MTYTQTLVNLGYLVGVIFFVIGLKRMSHPDSASRGNLLAGIGMGIGILIALFAPLQGSFDLSVSYTLIFVSLIIGGIIGYFAAVKVALTAMPEMVSLFNGFGGACSMLIGLTELYKASIVGSSQLTVINGVFALFVGAITFTGSVIAWGKLAGFVNDKWVLPFSQFFSLLFFVINVVLGVLISLQPFPSILLVVLFFVAGLIYGVVFVTPIGGGDMPVVISLLNSFSGIGATLAGLLYNNDVMVVGGILVGASGIMLTVLMCRAMNRSLFNVLVGGFGGSSSGVSSEDGEVKEVLHGDLAIDLKYAKKVIIVPGYGLAQAQAQHVCYELEKSLEAEGVQVYYGIHPVAGRMPGHMNVLLAEAQVPYDKLLELEPSNEQFESTDVVLIIGANDVVNPAAKDSPGSPIYGMPILDVQLAKKAVVLKRSMNPGYAGIQNPLFFKEKTYMLFGDAKESLSTLKNAIASS